MTKVAAEAEWLAAILKVKLTAKEFANLREHLASWEVGEIVPAMAKAAERNRRDTGSSMGTRTRTFPLLADYWPIIRTLRALRGTEHYRTVLLVVHELRLERQHRKRVEKLREDQSDRLFVAARDLAFRLRTIDLRSELLAFHREVTGHPVADHPSIPDGATVKLRAKIVAEEFFEVMVELVDERYARALGTAHDVVRYVIERGVPGKGLSLAKLARELSDLQRASESMFLAFGIDSRPVHAVVHRANMARAGGAVGPDGKRMKPPGWKPPDVEAVIDMLTRRGD